MSQSPPNVSYAPLSISVDTALFVFDIPLELHQVKYFRGAVSGLAGVTAKTFHQHNVKRGGENMYGYPLDQCRCHEGFAAIFAINEGIQTVKQRILPKLKYLKVVRLQHKEPSLMHLHEVQNVILQKTSTPITYVLRNGILLNPKNVKRWEKLRGAAIMKRELERIIASQILSFAKRMNWTISTDRSFYVEVEQFRFQRSLYIFKDMYPILFDVQFRANVNLPDGLAIGSLVSFGYGAIST